jgi:regulator of protease activity HflC (stomatin/prohibitin superfamily)
MDMFALVVLVVAIIFVARSLKVVPQQNAWVIERLGKFHGTLSPGLNILIPFVDRVAYRHSLKEIPLDVPSQVCITRDNTQLKVIGKMELDRTFEEREISSPAAPKPCNSRSRKRRSMPTPSSRRRTTR